MTRRLPALSIILAVILWAAFSIASLASDDKGSTPVATMAIIFGWIPSFLFIAMTRMQTEFVIALIRTSENSASIRKRLH
ncbi:DUF4282 domain-containing protein [Cutibacterium acnes]|nr:DUF4282 domain-containing protein [Cutibacterium acnes]